MDSIKRMALGEDYDAKPEIDADNATQPMLMADSVSFQSLPMENENDSEAAAAIRASMHERIKMQEAKQAEEERQKAIVAEQIRISEDETYREFLDFAHGHGMKDIPTKTELFSFYGLRPGEFDRVLGFIRLMREN